MAKRTSLIAALAVAVMMLAGCFATVRTRPMYTGVVYSAPPAVRYETPPPQPYAGAYWVQGSWQWDGSQWAWQEGYYTQPRAGYVYVQPRWERRGTGYVRVQGGWSGRRGGTVYVAPRRTYVAPRATVIVH